MSLLSLLYHDVSQALTNQTTTSQSRPIEWGIVLDGVDSLLFMILHSGSWYSGPVRTLCTH